MRFSDAPYLSLFTNGAALRTLATKVQSRAAMAWRNGDEDVGVRLAAFWTNQKALMDNQWGHPTDGEYLGIGYNDMRKACYKVQSELRMNPGADKKEELVEFIDYFINAGRALTNKVSKVSAIKLQYGTAQVGYNEQFRITVSLVDDTGEQVPASADNPLKGDWSHAIPTDKNWSFVYKQPSRSLTTWGIASILPGIPGEHEFTSEYIVEGVVIASKSFKYIRLNEDGSNPVAPPVVVPPVSEPEAKAGKNGIV